MNSVNRYRTVVIYGSLAVLMALFWLPFGLNNGCYADGWAARRIAEQDALVLSPLMARPIEFAILTLAYALTPDYWVALNLILLATMIGRAWLMYRLLTHLGISRPSLALAIAALFALYPADIGYFYLGSVSIQFSVFLLLAAIYSYISAWRYGAWWRWLFSAMCLLISIFTYDAAFIVALFVPLLLAWLHGGFRRGWWRWALFWYGLLGLKVLHLWVVASLVPAAFSYQSNLLAVETPWAAIIGTLLENIQRHFYENWLWQLTANRPEFSVLAAIAGLGMGAVIWLISREEDLAWRYRERRQMLQLLAVALVALVVGLLPYAFTVLRLSSERTFFYSSMGAAIMVGGSLWLLLRLLSWPKLSFALVLSWLIALASQRLLERHALYVDRYLTQAEHSGRIIEQMPTFAPDTTLVILDDSPDQAYQAVFARTSYYIQSVFQTVYQASRLPIFLCYPRATEPWGASGEVCALTSTGIRLQATTGIAIAIQDTLVPYQQLVIFRYTPETGVQLVPAGEFSPDYQPQALIQADAPLPPRYYSLLNQPYWR